MAVRILLGTERAGWCMARTGWMKLRRGKTFVNEAAGEVDIRNSRRFGLFSTGLGSADGAEENRRRVAAPGEARPRTHVSNSRGAACGRAAEICEGRALAEKHRQGSALAKTDELVQRKVTA